MDVEADWKNATTGVLWTTPGGDYGSEKLHEITVQRNEFGWVRFNVLKTVKDFIANPDKNFGFLLRNSGFSQEIDIATSEFETNTDYRPKMVIGYPASAAESARKRGGSVRMQRQIMFTTVNGKPDVANNGDTPVHITLSRLDGTTTSSALLPGGAHKILSTHGAGVYLLSVCGSNFTQHIKVSLFQ